MIFFLYFLFGRIVYPKGTGLSQRLFQLADGFHFRMPVGLDHHGHLLPVFASVFVKRSGDSDEIEDGLPSEEIIEKYVQSIMVMYLAHIGEIQASIWPDEMRKECDEAGMA